MQIAGVNVYSNIFTVYYSSSTTDQLMITPTTSAPYYVGQTVTIDQTNSLTKYSLTSKDTITWTVNGTAYSGSLATGSSSITPYQLTDIAKGDTYTITLKITGANGLDLMSNTLTIDVTTPSIQITTKSGDNSFVYGDTSKKRQYWLSFCFLQCLRGLQFPCNRENWC